MSLEVASAVRHLSYVQEFALLLKLKEEHGESTLLPWDETREGKRMAELRRRLWR